MACMAWGGGGQHPEWPGNESTNNKPHLSLLIGERGEQLGGEGGRYVLGESLLVSIMRQEQLIQCLSSQGLSEI